MLLRAWRRMRLLRQRERFSTDVRRELESHLAMEIEHRTRLGLPPDEARRTALRDFGGVGRVHEEVFDVRGITFWDTLAQDIRFGVRTLGRSPGYTAAAVLILALGIGVNTAMFSVIRGVLLEPLPFRDGDELVLIQQAAPQSNVADAAVSIQELADYRARLASVRDLVEYHGMNFVLLDQGEPDRINAGVVSANFFDMLGIRPLFGRTFIDEDDDIGAEAVLVLSHEYWQSKFGGDKQVLGRVLQMNNRPHTVVGVLPPFPQYPRANDVYMSTSACPFRAAAEVTPQQGHRSFAGLRVFGRLVPGATVEGAAAEVATIVEGFNRDYGADHEASTRSARLAGQSRSLQDQLTSNARPMLYALAAATALILLIACANVANLAMARTIRRGRELSVRTALGAGRLRLLRQLITESLIVAGAGGLLGLALASTTLDLLVQFIGRFTARTAQIDIDGGVLLFALAASTVTGVAFGAAPALAARRSLMTSMRDGAAPGGDSAARRRFRSALVVAQIAVSFVLLVGAALLLESFYRLSSVPLGHETARVITAAYTGNFSRMNSAQEAIRVQTAFLERLRATPGVEAAAITNAVPQTNIVPFPQAFAIDGRPPRDGVRLEADANVASDGYFDVLGIRLMAGRDFRAGDTAEAPGVTIINQSMAALWSGADPIGSRITTPGPGNRPIALTVIGIVPDFRLYGADREVAAQFYVPYRQVGFAGRVLVRAASDPYAVVPAIKAAVHGADPQIPVEDVQTLDELRRGRLATPRVTTGLLTIFAAAALAITLAGIAGLVATSVSQRTREFGLRMALGATRGSVLRLVLGQGAVLVAFGVAAGVAGAAGFSRLLAGYLFDTRPTDPIAYVAVAVVFLAAALAATFGPAKRATSIDPLVALRTD
jgi:predicted permease